MVLYLCPSAIGPLENNAMRTVDYTTVTNHQTLIQFAVSHGFDAHVRDGVVNVWIPWTDTTKNTSGTDRFAVETMADLRHVLGY